MGALSALGALMLRLLILLVAFLLPLIGCIRYRDDIEYDFPVEYVWSEPSYRGEFSVFQGVWWDGAIAALVDPIVADQAVATNRTVLDLFCGPGFIATLCGQENATSVLSVAESGTAKACARYNVAANAQDSIVTVRDLELAKSPILPATAQYEVILAVLADSAQLNSEISLDRKLEIFVECVRTNLKTSGRVFAICENDAIATKLSDLCQQQGLTATLQGNRLSTFSAWEMKVLAKPAGQPSVSNLPATDN
jgi:hypothetical protein